MKKIIGLLIFGILVFSGISNIVISKENQSNYRILDKILVSAPILNQEGEYISVSIDEADSLWLEPGKPQLPVVTKVYAFPLGTKIINVTIEKYSDEYELTKKVIPSPEPLQLSCLSSQCSNSNIINETVYGSSELYPSNSDHISKGAGLKDGEHVLFLNIKITPQYSPVNNLLLVPHEIKIIVEYTPPVEPLFNSDEYDMIIITNEDYISKFQRFIDHKNNLGIRTTIDSVENIYPNYDGRDEAEDIKLRIRDAIEEYGITYVLLAGGRKGQTLDWYIPNRRISNLESGRDCSSDHYFADIYKIIDDEVAFEDWDSNDNGLFAESSNEVPRSQWDEIDYYPDVVVGRLPFRYEHEIDPLIDKIIQYESSPDKQWFHNALVVSGDQYPPCRGGQYGIYEGEMETNVTANLLEKHGFSVVRLWQSTHSWNGRSDIIDALTGGLGFVHFACHGSPVFLGTYPADDEDGGLVEALKLRDIKSLDNSNSLPVVMIHGCHTAQFSVSLSNILRDINEWGLWDALRGARFLSSTWVPYDLTSAFLIKEDGGAIASFGYSGFGYFWGNGACLNGLCPWICTRFFDSYANQSIDIIGKARDQAIVDYLNIIGGVNINALHRNTIEGWILMGDPSLKIGGYPIVGGEGIIAFTSDRDGNNEIYTMSTDGTIQNRLTNHPGRDWYPDWSPDGEKLVFASDRDGNEDIFIMDKDGNNIICLTSNSTERDSYPQWSPDGSRILFSSRRDGNLEIYTMNINGSDIQRLTYNPSYDFWAFWSHDGSKIIFTSDKDNTPYYHDIYIMDNDGSNVIRLTEDNQPNICATMSPDGSTIAYSSGSSGRNEDIVLMDANGNNKRSLVSTLANDFFPCWSPNGEYIAFQTSFGNDDEIALVRVNTGEIIRLTYSDGWDSIPSWK